MGVPSAPDAIEAVVGWRVWELGLDPDGRPGLRSIGGAAWPAGEPLRARCDLLSGPGHAAPDPGCACGLHAAAEPSRLRGSISPDTSVLGTVALWGTVVEHRHGYRAELAYPASLRLVCGRCLRRRAHGGSGPVVVVPVEGGALVAACVRHEATLWGAGPARPAGDVEAELVDRYAVERLRDRPTDLSQRARATS